MESAQKKRRIAVSEDPLTNFAENEEAEYSRFGAMIVCRFVVMRKVTGAVLIYSDSAVVTHMSLASVASPTRCLISGRGS